VRKHSKKVTLKVFEYESSTSERYPSMHIHCGLCDREYDLLQVSDYSWIQRNLQISDPALASLKSIYALAEVNLDDLFRSITAVTKPSKEAIHICFEMFGIKSFMDCRRKESRLIGVDVLRI